MKVLLAVHSRVRPLVLSPGLFDTSSSIQICDLGDEPWASSWQADAQAEAIITGWGTPPITDQVLDDFPQLRAILHLGGSVREVIRSDVWSRGIQVVSAADANNESVADFVAAQMLLALKGSHRAQRTMRDSGVLPGAGAGPGPLAQRVGLVSYGSVAQKVRRRLRQWDAKVATWDPYVDAAVLHSDGVERAASLQDLFERSTVLSVHTPLIPGITERMITASLVRSLPAGAVFINTARGAIVDEAALVDSLLLRPDITAILDVTVEEPPARDSLLYDLPNVVLTGHTAGSVGTENRRMGYLIKDALEDISLGRISSHSVSSEAAALRA